ncbi:MAG: hypothetical protein GXO22_00795 [Aquificae bacterium]|nr:hypothetical protein [Aquificota bacterium]
MKIAIILYLLGILIGIYAVWNNLPALFTLNFSDFTLGVARFLMLAIPVGVGFFLIYMGILNIKELIQKEKKGAKRPSN